MKASMKMVLITVIAAWTSASFAQITSRWSSTSNGVWSDDLNWSTVAPPEGGGAAYVLEFMTASTYTADNDLDASFGDFNLNMLRLGGGAVTLTGNALRFVNNGAAWPVITNTAAVVVKVNNNIEAANSLNVGAAANGVMVLNGVISGAGGLTNHGAGAIVLTGNNTFTGETVVRMSNNAEWGGMILSNTTGGVAISGNLRLGDVNSYVRLGANEQIVDTAVITFGSAGHGRFQLLGRTETVAGIQTITDGQGILQNKDQNDAQNFYGGGTLILNPGEGQEYRFAGFLRGGFNAGATDTITLIKNGAGTQILAGNRIGDNNFVFMQINAGTLALSNTIANSFQTGIEIKGTGKLLIENARDASKSPITNNVANGLSFGLTNLVAIGGLSGSGAIELKNRTDQAVTLIIGSNNTAGAYSGNLSGDGSLIKVGTGAQVVSGNNTYTGTTLFTNGLVRVTRAVALPGYATPGRVTVGGPLALDAGGAGWTQGQINDLLQNSAFSANSSLLLDVATGTDVQINNALPITSGLTKTGGGTLILPEGSTYANGTAIYGGIVTIAGASSLGAAGTVVTNNGGVLRAAPGSGNFSLGRTILVGADGGGVAASLGVTFRLSAIANLGAQAGVFRIVDGGGGTVVLDSGSTHTGGTVVEAGTHVSFASAGAFGSGTLTIQGGRIRLNNAATSGVVVGNAVTLAGNVIFGTTGNSNPMEFSGPMTLSGGTHTVTVASDTAAGATTISGAIGDGGNGFGLIKAGTIDLILKGQNTYAGMTRVSAGTLRLEDDASLASATLQIDFGATMNVTGRTGGSMTLAANQTLQGEGTFVGGLIAGDQSIIAPGSSPGTLEVNGDLTFEGTATLAFDLLDNINVDSDYLNVIGDLKKGTGFDSVIFDFLGSGQMGTYALIGFVNSELVAGDFEFTNLKSGLSVDTVSLDNNELSLTVIPEPASLGALGILALAGLLRRRLRR